MTIVGGRDGSETIGLGEWQGKEVFSQRCGHMGQGDACYASVLMAALRYPHKQEKKNV